MDRELIPNRCWSTAYKYHLRCEIQKIWIPIVLCRAAGKVIHKNEPEKTGTQWRIFDTLLCQNLLIETWSLTLLLDLATVVWRQTFYVFMKIVHTKSRQVKKVVEQICRQKPGELGHSGNHVDSRGSGHWWNLHCTWTCTLYLYVELAWYLQCTCTD